MDMDDINYYDEKLVERSQQVEVQSAQSLAICPRYAFYKKALQPEIAKFTKSYHNLTSKILRMERGVNRLERDKKLQQLPKNLKPSLKISLPKDYSEVQARCYDILNEAHAKVFDLVLKARKDDLHNAMLEKESLRNSIEDILAPYLSDCPAEDLRTFFPKLKQNLLNQLDKAELALKIENNRKRILETERNKKVEEEKEKYLNVESKTVETSIKKAVNTAIDNRISDKDVKLLKDTCQLLRGKGGKLTAKSIADFISKNSKANTRNPKKNPRATSGNPEKVKSINSANKSSGAKKGRQNSMPKKGAKGRTGGGAHGDRARHKGKKSKKNNKSNRK